MAFISKLVSQFFFLQDKVYVFFRSYSGLGGLSYQVASASSAILEKLWTRVRIEPLSKEELTDVRIINVIFSVGCRLECEHKQFLITLYSKTPIKWPS